jgi:hypothetical protein
LLTRRIYTTIGSISPGQQLKLDHEKQKKLEYGASAAARLLDNELIAVSSGKGFGILLPARACCRATLSALLHPRSDYPKMTFTLIQEPILPLQHTDIQP